MEKVFADNAYSIMQEMTLEEYEKVLMEKRKALDALKATERKVEIDMAFNSMRMVDKKNDGNEVFLKLVSFLRSFFYLDHRVCLIYRKKN
jgi:hypothetical protein